MFGLENEEPDDGANHIIVAQVEIPIQARCTICNKILGTGNYVVLVTAGDRVYYLGHDTPITCCGIEEIRIRLFSDKERAIDAYEETAERIEDEGVESLQLVEAPESRSAFEVN